MRPQPTTSSALIRVRHVADTGRDCVFTCIIQSLDSPYDGPPRWPRLLIKALQKNLHFLDGLERNRSRAGVAWA
jgi:hypothetical protein